MDNDLKFFTNEPERDLYGRFCNILKGHTQFFDILVGYFRTSGFFKLYPAMKDLEKVRILVGLNVNEKTFQIIEQSKQDNLFGGVTIKEATEHFEKTVIAPNKFINSQYNGIVQKNIIDFLLEK